MTPRRYLSPRRKSRGQAMVEYSIINALLIVALMIGTTVRFLPSPNGATTPGLTTKVNVIELMLAAYRIYYDGIYLVLSSPYP